MRIFRMFCLSVVAGIIGAEASLAANPMPCSMHDDLVKMLNSKYSESLAGYGVAGQRNIVEVFIAERGSFTIIATNPNGVSCVIAAGQDWEKVAPVKNLTSL
jgi:hypothetical protein